ncbi:MAG: hypothetical protein QOH57_5031 [Mycobacterium sp.]|nr:hypothetical protein [Mycobacterium sp.]
MTAPWGVAVAAIFVWLGMVLAISFLETPLKFRAPGITLPLGLGIGRLVFRALNAGELLLGVVAGVAFWVEPPPRWVGGSLAAVLMVLAIQIVVVRPVLTRRSDTVLAGDRSPRRSHGHYVYIGLELIKVAALAVTGILLLSA